MTEFKRIGLSAVALTCTGVVCVLAALGLSTLDDLAELRAQAEISAQEASQIGIQGLPAGQKLDDQPNRFMDNFAVFDDRVAELFVTDEQTLTGCIESLNDFYAAIPSSIRCYCLISPTRAQFEESLSSSTVDQIPIIERIYDSISSNVIPIDAASSLESHKDEYIYYRTEESLTSRGAYWALTTLTDACGVTTPDIRSYPVDTRRGFLGGLSIELGTSLPEDVSEVFMRTDLPNEAYIALREGDHSNDLHKAPAIANSRGGGYASLGAQVSHAVISGANQNKRVLMIVGTSYAKSMATWCVESFERIVYVDIDWNTLEHEDFHSLLEQCGVTDLVVIQPLSSYSSGNANSSLKDLAG